MTSYPSDNSRKIVKQALSFETPDRLPVFDGCWGDYWFEK